MSTSYYYIYSPASQSVCRIHKNDNNNNGRATSPFRNASGAETGLELGQKTSRILRLLHPPSPSHHRRPHIIEIYSPINSSLSRHSCIVWLPMSELLSTTAIHPANSSPVQINDGHKMVLINCMHTRAHNKNRATAVIPWKATGLHCTHTRSLILSTTYW